MSITEASLTEFIQELLSKAVSCLPCLDADTEAAFAEYL